MSNITKRIRQLTILSVASAYFIALAAPLPLRVYAQEAPSSSSDPQASTTEQPTTPAAPEPSQPPAEQNKPAEPKKPVFIYNPSTGLWESERYTWDPVTKQTAPKAPPNYSYNPETKHWDTEAYKFSPDTKKYVPNSPASQNDSSPATAAPNLLSDTAPPPPMTLNPSLKPLVQPSPNIKPTTIGPATSSSHISVGAPTKNNYFDLFYDASISNQIGSTAATGDASVLQNTSAGSATSGDAVAMANIINMLQSTWQANGLSPQIYTADIQGNHFGDIIIDPSRLADSSSNTCGLCGGTIVNASSSASIDNDVNLKASTGSATVAGNTSAGSATSGDAAALANIMNMINSSISAGQSFLGVINIHGNLEGDVLVASDVINQLIAANVPTTQISMCATCSNLVADIDNNQSITNNIRADAASGAASVEMNTSAGHATSGQATTNVTVFNLTGQTVVGRDALLVFVNVQGEWIGFITNAPEGSTAAVFGSGVTESSSVGAGDAIISSDSDMSITNNIDVSATSGDASVKYNTSAGNATSGQAAASVNLANITNSAFSLSGWFGVLFINILGDWHGSFGTDTPYGNKLTGDNYGQSAAAGLHAKPPAGRPGHSMASPRLTIMRDKVKIFTASFSDDGQGNAVLASAHEQAPPPAQADHVASSSAATEAGSNAALPPILLVMAIVASFAVVVHGDSLRQLAFRGRQL